MNPPFNISDLGRALERRLNEVFREFRLPPQNPDAVPSSEPDRVTVYRGALPVRERDGDNNQVAPKLPLVIVRARTCDDDEGDGGARDSTVRFEFVLGARRLGPDGHDDIVAMAERIRTSLLRDPKIENGARFRLPLKSDFDGEENYPHWVGLMTAHFNIPQPVEEIAYD